MRGSRRLPSAARRAPQGLTPREDPVRREEGDGHGRKREQGPEREQRRRPRCALALAAGAGAGRCDVCAGLGC